MTIDELKTKVETYRNKLEEKSGGTCIFSKTGPVGMSVIGDIISTLEGMQTQFDDLKLKPKVLESKRLSELKAKKETHYKPYVRDQ